MPEAFFMVFLLDSKGAKACKSCRSRQDLSNEYLLAKFGFDTAENEPPKRVQKIYALKDPVGDIDSPSLLPPAESVSAGDPAAPCAGRRSSSGRRSGPRSRPHPCRRSSDDPGRETGP